MRTDFYKRHRFPTEIISHCVWLYHHFDMSFRAVEELLFERGVVLSYETVRRWCLKFGPEFARRLKRRRVQLGDKWHKGEVFLNISEERCPEAHQPAAAQLERLHERGERHHQSP